MRSTIAFNNSSNSWVSRYSYTTSCIGWIKDHMVTAPVFASDGNLFWKHDENATTNNRFYGCDAEISGVSFSFNNNPSQNKLFKSFSIESPSFLSSSGATSTFIVNNGRSPNLIGKKVVMTTMKSKGDILYGGLAGIQDISISNVATAGVVERILSYADFKDEFGDPLGPGQLETAICVKVIGPTSQYSGGQRAYLVSGGDLTAAKDTEPTNKILSNGYISYYNGWYFVEDSVGISAGNDVFIVYYDSNYDQPKGQVADVTVVFNPSENFEVYAMNVDYEPTTLDHNS